MPNSSKVEQDLTKGKCSIKTEVTCLSRERNGEFLPSVIWSSQLIWYISVFFPFFLIIDAKTIVTFNLTSDYI